MTERERPQALKTMRQAVMDQAYVVTPHALLEMREDHLDVVDY